MKWCGIFSIFLSPSWTRKGFFFLIPSLVRSRTLRRYLERLIMMLLLNAGVDPAKTSKTRGCRGKLRLLSRERDWAGLKANFSKHVAKRATRKLPHLTLDQCCFQRKVLIKREKEKKKWKSQLNRSWETRRGNFHALKL